LALRTSHRYEILATDRVDQSEAREILRQILEALRVMHRMGRVHRDLKLENVVVDLDLLSPVPHTHRCQEFSIMDSQSTNWSSSAASTMVPDDSPPRSPPSTGSAKIIDFDTVSDWEPTSPASKNVLGTDGYIAPEAYDGCYSPASDIYSVGVMMYALLTQSFPFRSNIFDDKAGENWVGSPAMKRVKERVKSTKVNFDRRPFDSCRDALELCSQMLAVDARMRPSALEALSHRWFRTPAEGCA